MYNINKIRKALVKNKDLIHKTLKVETGKPDFDILIEIFTTLEHLKEISKIAKEEGCRKMILISSMGANSKSNIFYISVKGLLEEALEEIEFEEFHILRPSILLGKRS